MAERPCRERMCPHGPAPARDTPGRGRHRFVHGRQILILEQELDEQVFLRVGGKLRITPAGQTLLSLSRRVFEDIEATRAAIAESRQTLAGTIRLVGGMTVCLYVFPPLIKEFRKHHPNVEVKVTPASATRLVRQLRTGAADLGLATLPVEDANLVIEPALHEELLLVMSPQHPLARKRVVPPRDLARQPFVLFEAGSNSRRTIEEFFQRCQISPRVVTETENVEIIKALVRIKLGIAIIPYQAMAREVAAGQLSAARIAGQSLVRETGWAYLRSARPPRAVVEMKRMLDIVAPKLKLMPRRGSA